MSEEQFTIGSGGKEIGSFSKLELIGRYNSLVKCEGIYVFIGAHPQPLWHAVTKWAEEPEIKALRGRRIIPLVDLGCNANEKKPEP